MIFKTVLFSQDRYKLNVRNFKIMVLLYSVLKPLVYLSNFSPKQSCSPLSHLSLLQHKPNTILSDFTPSVDDLSSPSHLQWPTILFHFGLSCPWWQGKNLGLAITYNCLPQTMVSSNFPLFKHKLICFQPVLLTLGPFFNFRKICIALTLLPSSNHKTFPLFIFFLIQAWFYDVII